MHMQGAYTTGGFMAPIPGCAYAQRAALEELAGLRAAKEQAQQDQYKIQLLKIASGL